MTHLDKNNASDEERAGGFDLLKLDDALTAKLDDLLSSDKIEKALKSVDDQETLFKSWYADESTSKAVLDRLRKTPVENIADKNILSRYKSFVKMQAKLDDLLNAEKIKNAMKTFDDQEALFKEWHVDEATAKAVSARLDQNRMPNFPIILKFNDYRTRHSYNKVLTDWVDTKMLDETAAALKNSKAKPMRELFQAWYDKGITSTEFTSALNTIKDANKRKRYVNFEHFYRLFIDMKVNEAKKAAIKAAVAAS
ncbi:RxLR effector protein [Phytophthora megakarya]|uniref:RxLR effector protein n=1 Tax=Phytophthora megakarya TaxID=4795 RepID=A0A225WK38_9STRA|nr:RxLR effector protein [Phytophthora megakarya]